MGIGSESRTYGTLCPVPDIHPLVKRVNTSRPRTKDAPTKDSWRGVRSVIHYSVSREDYLLGHKTNIKPDYNGLLEHGYKKAKLRAHSDMFWNSAVNEWAIQFNEDFDIMCESKSQTGSIH